MHLRVCWHERRKMVNYFTDNNRAWCKKNNILLKGTQIERPTEQTRERIKELRQEVSGGKLC